MGCFWQGLSALTKTSLRVSAPLQHQRLLPWPRCLLSIWRTDVCWAVPNCSWLQTDLKKSFSFCKAIVKNINRTSFAKTTKSSIHWKKVAPTTDCGVPGPDLGGLGPHLTMGGWLSSTAPSADGLQAGIPILSNGSSSLLCETDRVSSRTAAVWYHTQQSSED